MAFTVTNLNTSSDPGPSGSRTVNSVTASVGDLIVVVVATSNSGTNGAASAVTCADETAVNTWTQRTQVNQDPGAADEGVTLTIFTSVLTGALSSNYIRATFSPSSAQGSAIGAYKFAPGAGEAASYVSVGAGSSGAGTTPSITTGTITSGDTVVGAIAVESDATVTGDSDTSNGNWSTQYGATAIASGDLSGQIRSQHKTVTASATQTYNPTIGSSADYAINYIVIRCEAAAIEIDGDAGSYTITGTDASLEQGYTVAAGEGSYTITGTDAALERGYEIAADTASYTITGTDASLVRTFKATVDAGSYTITGTDATFAIDASAYLLTADAGTYSITGSTVSVLHGFEVAASAGSYTITGTDATLAIDADAYIITAGAGSYTITGTAASLAIANRTLAAAAGSYTITGTAASTIRALELVAATAAYSITGTAATLKRALKTVAAAGSYSITGTAATLHRFKMIAAAAGSYAITGAEVALITSGSRRRRVLAIMS